MSDKLKTSASKMKFDIKTYISTIRMRTKRRKARTFFKEMLLNLEDMRFDLTKDAAPHAPLKKVNRRRVRV